MTTESTNGVEITWSSDDGSVATARLAGDGRTWFHAHEFNTWRLLEGGAGVPWLLMHEEDVPDPVRIALCPESDGPAD